MPCRLSASRASESRSISRSGLPESETPAIRMKPLQSLGKANDNSWSFFHSKDWVSRREGHGYLPRADLHSFRKRGHASRKHLRRDCPGGRVGPAQLTELGPELAVLQFRLLRGLRTFRDRSSSSLSCALSFRIHSSSRALSMRHSPACSVGPTRSISRSAARRCNWKSSSTSLRSSTVASVCSRAEMMAPIRPRQLCIFGTLLSPPSLLCGTFLRFQPAREATQLRHRMSDPNRW
jgi:hypothetical protein